MHNHPYVVTLFCIGTFPADKTWFHDRAVNLIKEEALIVFILRTEESFILDQLTLQLPFAADVLVIRRIV